MWEVILILAKLSYSISIVGTLKTTYTHKNLKYKLPRHGFARECNFETYSYTENSATFFSLSSTPQYLMSIPFLFLITNKIYSRSTAQYLHIINIGVISYLLVLVHPASTPQILRLLYRI
jgi:hypothetical protein